MTGLAFPKPSPRVKVRKPLKRGTRPARVRKTARGREQRAADLKWAKAIRESGPCAALGVLVTWFDAVKETVWHDRCRGDMTAAHIVSRRYAATRTDPKNGMPLCAASHDFFTSHPLAWDAFVEMRIGAKRYAALKAKANRRTE